MAAHHELATVYLKEASGREMTSEGENSLTGGDVSSGVDSKEAADAATEQTASIWSGFAEFMAEDHQESMTGEFRVENSDTQTHGLRDRKCSRCYNAVNGTVEQDVKTGLYPRTILRVRVRLT